MAKRDVELIIRARDEATKGLTAITRALEIMEGAQSETGSSAVRLSEELAKIGSTGTAGRALKSITRDIEAVSGVLDKQNRRLDETRAEVDDYGRQLDEARAKVVAFAKAQETTVPRNKTALKRQAAEYEAVGAAVTKLEEKLAKSKVKLQQQTAEFEENGQALAAMREQSTQAALAMDKLAAGERKIAEAADTATKRVARLNATLAETKARKEALAGGKPLGAVLGSGDPAAQVRKAKLEFQAAAEKLVRLRREFRNAAAPSEELGRSIGEQSVKVSQLHGAYRSLSSQASDVISANKRMQAQNEAKVKSDQAAIKSANDLADARRRANEQTAKVRTQSAVETVSAARTDTSRQVVSQKQLREAVADLKAVYTQLDQELRKVQATSGLFGTSQDQLRGRLVTLQGQIRAGETALRQYESGAKGAATGVSTLARKAADAQGNLSRGASSAARASGELRKLVLGTRQSLGLLQRIRGQLLAIGASYIGVFGLANFTAGIANAQRDMDSIRNRFMVGFANDQAAATAELEFTRKTAKDLGLDFRTLGKEYSKLTAASLDTELQGENTRRIFVALAQSSRVLNLSADDTAGAMKAFTDIISKGTVQAEELRGQLGDRFPGAVSIMAKALGIGTAELSKMMEQGQLTRESLVHFADAMANRVAGALPEAVNTFDAQLQRLKTAWFETQIAIAESGFLDGIADGMQSLVKALQNPEVQAAFKQMGKDIGELVRQFAKLLETQGGIDSLVVSLRNLGTVLLAVLGLVVTGTVLQSLHGFKLAITGLIPLLAKLLPFLRALSLTMVLTLGPALGAAIAWIGGLAAAIGGPILLAIAALAAAVAAPFLYNWAYDNFPRFRKLAIEWGDSLRTVVEFVILQFKKLGTFMGTVFKSPLEATKSLFFKVFGEIFQFLGRGFEWLGRVANLPLASKLGAGLKQAGDSALESSRKGIEDYHKAVAKLEEGAIRGTIERKRKVGAQLLLVQREIDRENRADPKKVRGGKGAPGTKFADGGFEPLDPFVPGNGTGGKGKKTEAEKLADRVAKQIDRLEQRLAELKADDKNLSPAARLEKELAAIASKYQPVFNDLIKLGKGRNSREWQVVEALVAQEGVLARQKAAKEELEAIDARKEAQEKRVNDLALLREQIQNRITFLQEQGSGEDLVQLDGLKVKLNETNVELTKAIDSALTFYRTMSGPEAEAAIQRLLLLKGTIGQTTDKILSVANAGKSFGTILKASSDDWLDKIRETGDVFGSLKEAFRNFASDFLLQIAKMILQQALFNALSAAANSAGGGYATFFNAAAASVRHDGGLANSGGTSRLVPSAVFANAQRLHNGGIPGLKSNEVPTILEKNEEVLTRDDPRHVLNGGGAGSNGGSAQQMGDIKIINAIDSASVMSEALSSSAGGKVFFNFFRANKSALKQILQ